MNHVREAKTATLTVGDLQVHVMLDEAGSLRVEASGIGGDRRTLYTSSGLTRSGIYRL